MALNSKKDFQDLMYKFLSPLKDKYSEGNARIFLNGAGATYSEFVIEMESFSRPLWALVPFWFGGGEDKEFEQIYKNGLANGTNPNHKEYWGDISGIDQRFVEMAALATGLDFCKDKLWTPLSDEEKENLAKWLYQINGNPLPQNNWLFFRVLVNTVLKKHGMKYSAEQLEKDFAVIETYYLGDGWYKDGISEHRDYYVPFAMHYYGLLYSEMMKDEDPERSALYKSRATVFANDFMYFFANNGAAVPYGRSLTYRFAQCSFFSACLFAGIDIDLGIVKGILSRHFEYWLDQSIFDNSGVLSVGYAYQNLIMAERYNAPGSPYWGMKAFSLLGLPDNHPFWSVEAKPLPKMDDAKVFSKANMIIQRLHGGDDVVAFLPAELELYGHGHIIEKYSKFAYSTAFGFSVMRSAFYLEEACPDSMLAFIIDDTVFVRKVSKEYTVSEGKMTSKWTPFIGIDVETTITLTPNGHVRHHEIKSDFECHAIDFGFSLPKFVEKLEKNTDGNVVSVRSNDLFCEVKGIGGKGEGMVLDCFPNTNVLFKNTVLPGVKYNITKGHNVIDTEITT